MNIIDLNGNGFELQIALAGFSKENIQVEVKDKILNIKVEPPVLDSETVYLRQGISYRNMETSFQLNDKIDVSKISVKFVDGLLIINVPLKEDAETKTRKIKVL